MTITGKLLIMLSSLIYSNCHSTLPKITHLYFYDRDAQIQFAVEAGHTCHFYYEPNLAKEHFTRAHKLSELEIELTGKRNMNF